VVTASAVRIAAVYPELLGTYGDGGNLRVLERRLSWRGIAAECIAVPLNAVVPRSCDLYLLGGGEDDAQILAAEALRRSDLAVAVRGGAAVFAVCAGLQLLGHHFETASKRAEKGLGVLDLTTSRLPTRAVGEVVSVPDPRLGLPLMTGFENHGGATALGPGTLPLASVLQGTGNGAGDRSEGAVQGSIIATYLHGPVLARNPALADLVLGLALRTNLEPLADETVHALRAERLGRYLRS
jgi:CobQ-like glutamine amidotransferase family enzyme